MDYRTEYKRWLKHANVELQKELESYTDKQVEKTIVTMDLGERIAAHYGVETKNVLTGFKFIGEQIGMLEKAGHVDRYILDLRSLMVIFPAPMYAIRTV